MSDTPRTTERTALHALVCGTIASGTLLGISADAIATECIALMDDALRASEGGRMDDQSRSDQPQPAVETLTHAAITDADRKEAGFIIRESVKIIDDCIDGEYVTSDTGLTNAMRDLLQLSDRLIGSGTDSASEASTDSAQERSAKEETLTLAPSVEGTETAKQTIQFLQQECASRQTEIELLKIELANRPPSAVSGDQRQAGWQPIASAPKDRPVLLKTAEGAIALAVWFPDEVFKAFPGWTRHEWPIDDAHPPTHWADPPPSGSSAEQETTK